MTTCLVYNQCVLVSGAGVSALCSVCVQSRGGPLSPGFVLCALYLCSGVISSVVVFFLFLHCNCPVFCSVFNFFLFVSFYLGVFLTVVVFVVAVIIAVTVV